MECWVIIIIVWTRNKFFDISYQILNTCIKRRNDSWAYNFDTLSAKFGQWNILVAPQSYCNYASGDKMITIIFFVLSKRTNWCLFYLRCGHEYPFNIARVQCGRLSRENCAMNDRNWKQMHLCCVSSNSMHQQGIFWGIKIYTKHFHNMIFGI